jgi:hypothetical protein
MQSTNIKGKVKMHYNQRLNHDKKQKEIDKLNSHNNEHRILTRATRTKATNFLVSYLHQMMRWFM